MSNVAFKVKIFQFPNQNQRFFCKFSFIIIPITSLHSISRQPIVRVQKSVIIVTFAVIHSLPMTSKAFSSIYSKVNSSLVFRKTKTSFFFSVGVSGGERLQENRYLRLHIYRCHWCAPIDAHYNTARQLSQHVRSKHYRLLQALLTTQANMLQNNSTNSTRGKRTRDVEQDDNLNSIFSVTTTNSERTSNVLNSNNHHDPAHRLPIPIGLPDPLTDRDCQHLFTVGEQVAYNASNCIDGTLEDIKQNETFCRQQMDDENEHSKLTALEHFLTQYPLVRDLLGPRRRHDDVIQHLSDDYFDHPKNQNIDMSKYYQRQKSIPERRFIMNRFSCLLCTERFSSPIDLIEHEKLIHEKTISASDWGWNSIGFLQSNPYVFILELENELKQQQLRTKNDSNSFRNKV